MYRERASRLAGGVVWTRTADRPATARILPDGCTDLIWTGRRLLVAGPDTRAHLVADTPGARYVGLRFAPGTGPAVFGVPAAEVRDRRVPLAALWPRDLAEELTERAAAAADPARVLEAAAGRRLRAGAGPDPLCAAVLAAARDGRPVASVARSVGLGERQLHRRCLAAFGYGPKTLARVVRLRRAIRLARAGVPSAEVASAAGYADQAHLAREVKALTGVTLGVLLGG